MKHFAEDVLIRSFRQQADLSQIGELAGKHVNTVYRFEAGIAFEESPSGLDHPVALVLKNMMEEANDGQDVASLLLIFGIDRINGTADKHPQRPLQVVGTQGFRLFLEHPLLLVERQ